MAIKTLVHSWLAAHTSGGEPISVALSGLNEALRTDYTLSRLGEWRNGKRSIPHSVQRYMLETSLHHVLKGHGIDPPSIENDFYQSMADALLPPER